MTLATLRAQCRLTTPSTTDWPNATIDGWIADAIRFYSARFPRLWRYTQTLTTGTQQYNLPGAHGFFGILSVEYPAGQDPPEYLLPADPWSPAFQADDDVYAIYAIADTTAIESVTAAAQIWFAPAVTTGQSAVITYHGLHAIPTAGDDDAQITIPTAHWEALIAFVEFRAHWELESDEAYTATISSVILAQLGENARRAWNRVKELFDFLTAHEARSAIVPWKMPR